MSRTRLMNTDNTLPAGGGRRPEATNRRHLPLGVREYLWQDARLRQQLEAAVNRAFRTWGYNTVILPMFEFGDMLTTRTHAAAHDRLYRFLDMEGRTLILRPDMTAAVARLVGTRLAGMEGPFRFCYAGSVFRHEETSGLEYQQEFRQAGIELVGSADAMADAEILACMAAGLNACNLSDFRIVVGHADYYGGLLDALDPQPSDARQLRWAMHRKSEHALARFVESCRPSPGQRATLENLLTLQGADVSGLLERAAGFCLNRRMESALLNLRKLTEQLDAYGILERVTLDLAEYRNLEYYTGMTFEFLLPDSAAVAGSGGRYDGLIGKFGRSRPAVGGILHLDRLVRAVPSNQAPQTLSPKPPLCLVGQTKSGIALASMGRLRQQGRDIVVHTDPLSESGLLALGRSLGARVVAAWCDPTRSFHVLACPLPECVGPMDVAQFEQLLESLQRTELSGPDQSTAIMAGGDV